MDTSVIDILNTLFWVCLSGAILFFIISVVLFFVFDIRTIFNIKTGRAQAKTVKEMKAANESTGRLRVAGKTQTTKLTKEQMAEPRVPAVAPPEAGTQNQYYNSGADETELLEKETEVLHQGEDETSLLSPEQPNNNYSETTVLSDIGNNGYNETVVDENEARVGFTVIKNIVLVHTNEII